MVMGSAGKRLLNSASKNKRYKYLASSGGSRVGTPSSGNGGIAIAPVANLPNKKATLSIRSDFHNIIALMEEIKPKLRPEHILAMYFSSFRHLLVCIYEGQVDVTCVKKVGQDVVRVLKSYDREQECFVFGTVKAHPTEDDVRFIFGVEDGDVKVKLNQRIAETPFLLRQNRLLELKHQKIRLSANYIKLQIMEKIEGESEDDVEDVARLLTLYIMGTLLLTPESSYMQWGFVEILNDYKSMRKYNWCREILKATMNSLRNGNIQYGGCPIFLLFWICEHSNIVTPFNNYLWPRFRKWNLSELSANIRSGAVVIQGTSGVQWSKSLNTCECEWAKVAKSKTKEVGETVEDCNHSYLSIYTIVTPDWAVQPEPVENLPASLGGGDSSTRNVGGDSLKDPISDAENEKVADCCLGDSDMCDISTLGGWRVEEEDLLSELNHDEGEVLELIRMAHEQDNCALMVLDALFKKDAEVRQLKEMNSSLQNDLLAAKKVNQELLESIAANEDRETFLISNCKCKKKTITKKLKCIIKKSGGVIPKKAVKGSRKSADIGEVSAVKVNSMVKRLKERPLRAKKRNPDYSYGSRSKKAKQDCKKRLSRVHFEVAATGEIGGAAIMPPLKLLNREYVQHTLGNISSVRGRRGAVWASSLTGDAVRVDHLELLVDDGELNDAVINGSGELMQHEWPHVKIVDAGSYQYIVEAENDDHLARWYVDAPLEDFREYELIMFPINTPVIHKSTRTACHWTLLVFDVKANKWYHFNSLLPHNGGDDGHYKNACEVKKYIEKKMKDIIELGAFRGAEPTKFVAASNVENVMGTPQQHVGTLDCGVFVCIIMDRIMRGVNPIAPVTKEDVDQFRLMLTMKFIENGKDQQF